MGWPCLVWTNSLNGLKRRGAKKQRRRLKMVQREKFREKKKNTYQIAKNTKIRK